MNALVFLGGELPSPELAKAAASRAAFVVVADGGYHALAGAGIRPDVVTGDFDSIGALPRSEGVKIVPAKEQDATDFEKALRLVPEGVRTVEILGGTGLRSDHFLTNLLIAAGLPPHLKVVFHDDLQSIHRVTAACPYTDSIPSGTIVSLIPFAECSGVSTSGLHWNLDLAAMGPGAQLGQSNRADQDPVRVRLLTGTLYVVVNHPGGLH